MTGDDFIKLLTQSGAVGAMLFILGRIAWIVGNRMISAIDRIGVKLDEHTTKDVAAWTDVGHRLSHIEGKIGDRALTPIEGTPIITDPYREPPRRRRRDDPPHSTEYARRGTHHDGDDDGR